MSTAITIIVQRNGKAGSAKPDVSLVKDTYRFETDAQADDYFFELQAWVMERPIPDPEIHPFPRKKMRDPMDIIPILDDMLIPECLHLNP